MKNSKILMFALVGSLALTGCSGAVDAPVSGGNQSGGVSAPQSGVKPVEVPAEGVGAEIDAINKAGGFYDANAPVLEGFGGGGANASYKQIVMPENWAEGKLTVGEGVDESVAAELIEKTAPVFVQTVDGTHSWATALRGATPEIQENALVAQMAPLTGGAFAVENMDGKSLDLLEISTKGSALLSEAVAADNPAEAVRATLSENGLESLYGLAVPSFVGAEATTAGGESGRVAIEGIEAVKVRRVNLDRDGIKAEYLQGEGNDAYIIDTYFSFRVPVVSRETREISLSKPLHALQQNIFIEGTEGLTPWVVETVLITQGMLEDFDGATETKTNENIDAIVSPLA